MQTLTITRPDDWHLHLRDQDKLERTVADTARQFSRAIIMPNLKPPVATVEDALAYRDRILKHLPKGSNFTPLMTLYLTDNTTPKMIKAASECEHIYAVKLYPAGATTNSAAGVTDLSHLDDVLAAMQEYGIPLLIHGEVTHDDIFDREALFIEQVLKPLKTKFPRLKMVLEHITTKAAVDFVRGEDEWLAATITPHHLLLNRNQLLSGGIKPDYYCLPILKRETDRQALLQAATSGSPKFFLGTDSAPHSIGNKYSSCGCAGIYSAHNALELYATAFANMDALDKLEGFASFYGADFYGLPRNTDKVTLKQLNTTVPEQLSFGGEKVVPLYAGQTLEWSFIDE